MRPDALDHYVVLKSNGIEPLRIAFAGLDSKDTVIVIRTRMSWARWDIIFQFHATKLKTMAQVCEMSSVGVVNEVRDIHPRPDTVSWETSLLESPDMMEGYFIIHHVCRSRSEIGRERDPHRRRE